ncbi:6238_t:CDS:2 [Entrophospora sp. SA101]|nr:14758_t:CDS:2 [Entrophospora sp. SA101]CAJ0753488.1 6238_t:CDS:2 [Entrophospora sp. SA101]CAJ0914164.1 1235_t:CDS:2 [Entrophospora sp. SA101]CAJ0914175.1 1239_t:CDS:2 [Entrophospora sp. SA101]
MFRIRRSNWKTLHDSTYLLLQQKNISQQNNSRNVPEYRIITKSFPHYRIAGNDDLNQIRLEFDSLLHDIEHEMEGKITSKKILKHVKDWSRGENNSFEDDGGYATDASISPEDGNTSANEDYNDPYLLAPHEIVNSSSSSTKSEKGNVNDDDIVVNNDNNDDKNNNTDKNKNKKNKKGKNKTRENDSHQQSSQITPSHDQLDFTINQHSSNSNSNSDYSDGEEDQNNNNVSIGNIAPLEELLTIGTSMLDSFMNWIEGPPITDRKVSSNVASLPPKNTNNNPNSSNNKNQTILDIPMQFIDLLTYPDIDPKASKPSFAATSYTAVMTKSSSQDAIQSGSMSDTSYGGNVPTKFPPKRGGFFHSPLPPPILNSSSNVDLVGSSSLYTNSTASSSSTAITNQSNTLIPTSPTIIGSLNDSSSTTNSTTNNASLEKSTSKRKFFTKRNIVVATTPTTDTNKSPHNSHHHHYNNITTISSNINNPSNELPEIKPSANDLMEVINVVDEHLNHNKFAFKNSNYNGNIYDHDDRIPASN